MFASGPPDAGDRTWSFAVWQPHATFGRRRLDLPGSWRTLVCLCPALRPRQDRCSQAIRDTGTAPANVTTKAHHDSSPFEAQSHGFGTGCLRFAPPVTRTGRKTRFRLLARLCRVGLVTHRIRTKGFHDASYIASPFPKLSWRKTFWNTEKGTLARLSGYLDATKRNTLQR